MKTERATALKVRAREVIADLQSEQDPILITQHGKPAAYLADVDSYDELNRRLSVVEGIAPGEQAVREGRVHTQAEAMRRLSKWVK